MSPRVCSKARSQVSSAISQHELCCWEASVLLRTRHLSRLCGTLAMELVATLFVAFKHKLQ